MADMQSPGYERMPSNGRAVRVVSLRDSSVSVKAERWREGSEKGLKIYKEFITSWELKSKAVLSGFGSEGRELTAGVSSHMGKGVWCRCSESLGCPLEAEVSRRMRHDGISPASQNH